MIPRISCFSESKVRQQTLPLEESPVPLLVCDKKHLYTLHLGPYRDLVVISLPYYNLYCYEIAIKNATLIVTIIGMLLHVASLCVIAKVSLWKERKYLQLLLLNFSSIFVGFGLLYFHTNRSFIAIEQLACTIRFQIFVLGGTWNIFALISLCLDCVVAVYWPLKFRALLTAKQFFVFNGSSFISILIISLSPIFLYGFTQDGLMVHSCVFYYIQFSVSHSFFLLCKFSRCNLL